MDHRSTLRCTCPLEGWPPREGPRPHRSQTPALRSRYHRHRPSPRPFRRPSTAVGSLQPGTRRRYWPPPVSDPNSSTSSPACGSRQNLQSQARQPFLWHATPYLCSIPMVWWTHEGTRCLTPGLSAFERPCGQERCRKWLFRRVMDSLIGRSVPREQDMGHARHPTKLARSLRKQHGQDVRVPGN